jgi:proteasome assembly chaperone (PAC2) family protein
VIEPEDLPTLSNPVVIAAFEGWNDAGDSASGTIAHLADVWDAQVMLELDPEEYYDYQVNRPIVSTSEAGVRQLIWPSTRLLLANLPERDIVLVQGPEPNIKWQQFTREILGLAVELDVELVITLGALLSDSPHTRPVPVSGTSTDAALTNQLGLEPSTYEGPTGIIGVIQEACARFDIPAISLWGAVPHYVAQPPCPKATLALVRRLEDVLDLTIPLGDLLDESRAWEAGVDELASDDEEVADYVKQLEHARDTADLPEASGEAIAREFERYLRRRGSE